MAEHKGSHRTRLNRVPARGHDAVELSAGGGTWHMRLDEAGDLHAVKGQVIKGNPREVAWGLSLFDPEWSTENYVLIPGAVYGGNCFHAKPYAYAPPVVGPDPEGTDRTPWIGDLPRLQLEAGPSHLDQLSIDTATPRNGRVLSPAAEGPFSPDQAGG
ncbi:MAG: hypothetical protein ACP5I4_13460 [Oceanipulchritudo sp.]